MTTLFLIQTKENIKKFLHMLKDIRNEAQCGIEELMKLMSINH